MFIECAIVCIVRESSTRGDLSSLFTDIPLVEELAGRLERLLRFVHVHVHAYMQGLW